MTINKKKLELHNKKTVFLVWKTLQQSDGSATLIAFTTENEQSVEALHSQVEDLIKLSCDRKISIKSFQEKMTGCRGILVAFGFRNIHQHFQVDIDQVGELRLHGDQVCSRRTEKLERGLEKQTIFFPGGVHFSSLALGIQDPDPESPASHSVVSATELWWNNDSPQTTDSNSSLVSIPLSTPPPSPRAANPSVLPLKEKTRSLSMLFSTVGFALVNGITAVMCFSLLLAYRATDLFTSYTNAFFRLWDSPKRQAKHPQQSAFEDALKQKADEPQHRGSFSSVDEGNNFPSTV